VVLTTGEFWEPAAAGSERDNAIYLLNPASPGTGSGAGQQSIDPDYPQALFALHSHNTIQLIPWGKTHYIDVFPNQYKDNMTLQLQLGNPK
jgi:hypothetical protein